MEDETDTMTTTAPLRPAPLTLAARLRRAPTPHASALAARIVDALAHYVAAKRAGKSHGRALDAMRDRPASDAGREG